MSLKSHLPRSVLLALALVAGLGSFALAQPGGGRFGGGFGGFGGGSIDLLRGDDIRKELELVDDQIKKLDAISEKQRDETRKLFEGMRDLNDEQRRAKIQEVQETMQKRNEATQKEIDDVLLPHQAKRLKQLGLQRRMRGFGGGGFGGGGGSSDVIAAELKLSDKQKEALQNKAKEIEQDMRDKMAKVRKDAEAKLLEVLTPEQRKQWTDMVGEAYEFRPPQFGGGGGAAGGAAGGQGRPPRRSGDN